ncbi:hypothetical protein MAR_023542 [Mya arenaria]|uniref:Mitochondria-eating protein C-terminal domain-containing protein n=1 Tax=Mya arenaria TaxID=6604 RepID=A0ABY7DRG4_MYAAR|nr:uncharacterized protein LOC128226516 [Mya arenaria]WAQ99169.1 hypothetical protein MAR_023542 [Mya arenaria]
MGARLRTQSQINEQTQQHTMLIQNDDHSIRNDKGWWKYIRYLNPIKWARCICRVFSGLWRRLTIKEKENEELPFLLNVYGTRRRLQIKEKENEELRAENIKLRYEKNEAITRLSQLVSVQLRDNNPNVVDLGDPYRPTKLAEMFSELYDNEWTAAFMELEKEAFEDRHIIEILLNVLMVSYAFCAKTLEDNWETVSQWYFDKNAITAKQTAKALKDGRKVLIPNHFAKVQKEFCEHLFNICRNEKLKQLLQRDAVKSYIAKCVQLSLLMNATDPPLVMKCESDTEKRTGRDLYNKDMFKEYTKRGKYFDFCTWPVLFLHEDGPILSKGVAQGVSDPDGKDMGKAKTWFRLKF